MEAFEFDSIEKYVSESCNFNVLESLPIGIVVVNMHGRITTFNREAEKITGLICEDVRGKEVGLFLDNIVKGDIAQDFNHVSDIHKKFTVETEVYRKDKALSHLSLTASPVINLDAKQTGVVFTLQDITEPRKMQKRSNRTRRLAAMGKMSMQIAHEIRNPLGSIELFATTLKNKLEAFDELRILAENISSGVRNINHILSNMLMFGRPQQEPTLQVCDIHGILKDSLFFSSHLTKSSKSLDVITKYYPKNLMVYGDPQLLKQMSLNLILNAIQAMPNGGQLTISTGIGNGRGGEPMLAEIRFSDTGEGISRSKMDKIFDPFYTTKKGGTGLGLSIVHNILKMHKGSIDISSSKGDGSECVVTLPLWGENNVH